MTRTPSPRALFVVLAALSLLAALDAGLFRIGWAVPLLQVDLPLAHGPLMVSGFLGTLIGLEKAVAFGKRWAYLGPAASGAGGVGIALATDALAPRALVLAGSGVLVAVLTSFYRRTRTRADACVLAGAALWFAGNALWLFRWPVFAVVPSWIGFLLLTIAGERLELNRLMSPSKASRRALLVAVLAALAGIALAACGSYRGGEITFDERGTLFASPLYSWGVRVLGASLLALGAWLLSNDMARVTVRRAGLPRFMATALLLGYAWLVVAGALSLFSAGYVAGELYDGMLHTFFLGFTFSMIFAHGPVIFPAILDRPIEFRPALYAPLALLHLGLALRFVGDLTEGWNLRPVGGLLNAVAILLFLATMAASLRSGPRQS